MARVEVEVGVDVARSFRVEQVAGMFDVPLGARSSERFVAEVPGLEEEWQVGAIVGPSGSGKSTVARRVYGEAMVTGFDWPGDGAVVDGFPEELEAKAITATLNAVGFSSPPAWVRPYRVLSGGQRFRADLARALLLPREVVAFDEFTSVVDRTVAKVGSACVAKAVRGGRSACRRFVAVTCHYDVLEWLQPDWWVDMGTTPATLARGLLQRPKIRIEVRRAPGRSGRRAWAVFGRHHYLSGELHKAARCYVATWDGSPVAFCATLANVGHVGRRTVTRLVVLPDYQGLGIGLAVLERVVAVEAVTHQVSIRTSHPALIRALGERARAKRGWRVMSVGNGIDVAHHGMLRRDGVKRSGSFGRLTASFEWVGDSDNGRR